MIENALAKARQHQLVLKIGMLLTIVSCIGLVAAIVLLFTTGHYGQWISWKRIILWIATTLFMFNVYGINNNTSLGYYKIVYKKNPELLTADERSEFEQEIMEKNPALDLEPAPKTSYGVLIVGLLLMAVAILRLIQGFQMPSP